MNFVRMTLAASPTLVQKILAARLVSGKMVVGEEIGMRIDQTLTQDATGTMATGSLLRKMRYWLPMAVDQNGQTADVPSAASCMPSD